MVKVYLWYQKDRLGCLTEEEKGYVWTPDLEKLEEIARENPFFALLFRLPRERTVFDRIPSFYDEFAFSKRRDILEMAGVLPTDAPFARLVKMATLKWYTGYFYPSLSDTYPY